MMKRKNGDNVSNDDMLNTSKPTAVFEPAGGRAYTLSVALPGSIIANALTAELKTLLAGQIARALAVFCVDEVVIFDDGSGKQTRSDLKPQNAHQRREEDSFSGFSNPGFFLAHILSYLETPPFLRKHLFPMHPDLRLAGSLPSLDMPHHLRANEWCEYREGVSCEGSAENRGKKKIKKREETKGVESGTLIDVGLSQKVSIPASIPPKTRVTINLPSSPNSSATEDGEVAGTVVRPEAPREEAGYYWGYSVRSASSLSAVITECTFSGGYDLTFGTSERGVSIPSLFNPKSDDRTLPHFKHMLVVFGGVAGLEMAVSADEELQKLGVTKPANLFDYWINLCPGQGSRTIRTEEAVWLGLMGLREVVMTKGMR